jgi:hypothetical protein
MTLNVDTSRLRRAGSQIRASALDVAPGPAAGYQDGLRFDDAGGSRRLVGAVADFADGWRSALTSLAAMIDQVGVLACAAAEVYDDLERAAAETFGAAGDGLGDTTGGRT